MSTNNKEKGKVVKAAFINCFIGKMSNIPKYIEEFKHIFNQKPYLIKSKKASNSFRQKAGLGSGLSATLRGKQLENFLTILKYFILPSLRNFKGFKPSIVNGSNINLGITSVEACPHLVNFNIQLIKGFNITLQTTESDATSLLPILGIPLIK